ncbi:MAG: FAD-binding protein [candidate division NC10 bacterium]|nr:FAD-binding protein [candidate division NC10 bacterium]
MERHTLSAATADGRRRDLPHIRVHTLVIGSGAAGLNAAVQLRRHGVDDVLILTEGLDKGTSINTGSDKQTYYKLAMCGDDADSPHAMAETYFAGGSMHGDLALVEASLSARAFLHLVTLGVPFPTDAYGQFVGYKTDHDPRQRATSIGPYTSQEMCRALIREAGRLRIPIREGRFAIALITVEEDGARRAAGALALNGRGQLEIYEAENVVYATGGPGGLYHTSVYPEVHTGGIGVALLAGAQAQNLPESQYGLASIGFRWNVSGTYMQVVPRFLSTAADGASDAREFLRDAFASVGEMGSMVFLKGYQWPFDSRKIVGGSSLIDVLVYIETVVKGRRVFLDYRENGAGFSFADLSPEALAYLTKSQALHETPLGRLQAMNPAAVALYRKHGIDLAREPIEIAVCAQHNNGGLAANHWWEAVNLRHLFPVGEVNGSHGIYRPGGSALNSGQVGGFRAAEFIARRYADRTLEAGRFAQAAAATAADALRWSATCRAGRDWREERRELQQRMTRAGAHIRRGSDLAQAVEEARDQWRRLQTSGCRVGKGELPEAWSTRQLCFAHLVYLEAIRFAVESGAGSRGSSVVLDPGGTPAHEGLGPEWSFVPPDPEFRERVLETEATPDGAVTSRWVSRRPLPTTDTWFETAWAAFRSGTIYS